MVWPTQHGDTDSDLGRHHLVLLDWCSRLSQRTLCVYRCLWSRSLCHPISVCGVSGRAHGRPEPAGDPNGNGVQRGRFCQSDWKPHCRSTDRGERREFYGSSSLGGYQYAPRCSGFDRCPSWANGMDPQGQDMKEALSSTANTRTCTGIGASYFDSEINYL